MRSRISVRGCVRPSVRPSVGPSVLSSLESKESKEFKDGHHQMQKLDQMHAAKHVTHRDT